MQLNLRRMKMKKQTKREIKRIKIINKAVEDITNINQDLVDGIVAAIVAPIHSKILNKEYITFGELMRAGLQLFKEGERGRVR